MKRAVTLVILCLAALPVSGTPAHCGAASGAHRVPLLELYTSEGCDSCPPTDRWVSELPGRGYGRERVVVLAYHVDYWDRLGWIDPYAQARFSQRQRVANNRQGARVIYTPQLMLNGIDYRRGTLRDEFGVKLAGLAGPATAALRMRLAPSADRVAVSGASTAERSDHAQAWLALYENGLATDVRAGENRGKRLQHDFVVRELAGPFGIGVFDHAFTLKAGWKEANLGVAAFVADARSGEALQALALPVCR